MRIAPLAQTRCPAGLVYLMMKPLKWLFLLVLYAVDHKPENRIHVQDCKGKIMGGSVLVTKAKGTVPDGNAEKNHKNRPRGLRIS
ncbi:DUF6688 family protein [Neobacillus sp. Marseille-QA0830]